MIRRIVGWIVALGVLVAIAIAVAGCGEDPQGVAERTGTAIDTGMEHVHAVGVDPGDGAVMLATHAGLFRLADGTSEPERVGDLQQDTMGFTVIGPGRYLGSGHPDLRTDLPPLLGLISSDDGGVSWTPVSLLGEADFHILRASGTRVAGVDSHSGALMVSDDSGASWTRRSAPPDLVDLVVDPARPDVFVATTATGTVVSRDTGRTWTAVPGGAPALLTWPERGDLHRVTGVGVVWSSPDGGATWKRRGQVTGRPSALGSGGPGHLVVVTHEGQLIESRDGGETWVSRAVLA